MKFLLVISLTFLILAQEFPEQRLQGEGEDDDEGMLFTRACRRVHKYKGHGVNRIDVGKCKGGCTKGSKCVPVMRPRQTKAGNFVQTVESCQCSTNTTRGSTVPLPSNIPAQRNLMDDSDVQQEMMEGNTDQQLVLVPLGGFGGLGMGGFGLGGCGMPCGGLGLGMGGCGLGGFGLGLGNLGFGGCGMPCGAAPVCAAPAVVPQGFGFGGAANTMYGNNMYGNTNAFGNQYGIGNAARRAAAAQQCCQQGVLGVNAMAARRAAQKAWKNKCVNEFLIHQMNEHADAGCATNQNACVNVNAAAARNQMANAVANNAANCCMNQGANYGKCMTAGCNGCATKMGGAFGVTPAVVGGCGCAAPIGGCGLW